MNGRRTARGTIAGLVGAAVAFILVEVVGVALLPLLAVGVPLWLGLTALSIRRDRQVRSAGDARYFPVRGGNIAQYDKGDDDDSVAELQTAYQNIRRQAGEAEREGRHDASAMMHSMADDMARLLRVGRPPRDDSEERDGDH